MLKEIKEIALMTLITILGILWGFGAVAGAIYWAMNDDLLNVVLSMLIPLYGAVSLIINLFL